MRTPVLIALAALALTACATAEPPPAAPVASASTPAPMDGYDWFFHQEGRDARLVYGLAESDDMRLGLDCSEASGRLTLSAVGAPDAKPEIHIESGGETERFPAQSEPSQIHDGVFLTADADPKAPVFQRFRRIGWLALWQDGERQTYAPHPASAGNIERFFAYCG